MKTLATLLVLLLVQIASPQASFAGNLHVVKHPDGSTRWSVQTRQGVPHGDSTTWHQNGSIASSGSYKEGKRHGEFQYWDEQGVQTGSAVYVDGVKSTSSQKENVNLDLADNSASRPSASRNDALIQESQGRSKKTAGFVVLGIGAAAIIGGATMSSNQRTCSEAGLDASECLFRNTSSSASDAVGQLMTMGLGVGLTVTGIALIANGSAKEKRAQRAMDLSVSQTQGGAKANLRLSF